jgi:hypothetical protein
MTKHFDAQLISSLMTVTTLQENGMQEPNLVKVLVHHHKMLTWCTESSTLQKEWYLHKVEQPEPKNEI